MSDSEFSGIRRLPHHRRYTLNADHAMFLMEVTSTPWDLSSARITLNAAGGFSVSPGKHTLFGDISSSFPPVVFNIPQSPDPSRPPPGPPWVRPCPNHSSLPSPAPHRLPHS